MNKTNIILFMLDFALLKLWNLSSAMRKRLIWILKHRYITVVKYDPRILKLSNFIKIGKQPILFPSKPKKGVSNYKIQTQGQIEAFSSINPNFSCILSLSEPIKPIKIENTFKTTVLSGTYDFYLNLSFNRIRTLELIDLSSLQIRTILSKVKNIQKLKIEAETLQKLDLSKIKVDKIELDIENLTERLQIPSKLKKLQFHSSSGFSKLSFSKISILKAQSLMNFTAPDLETLKATEAMFKFTTYDYSENDLEFLPSSVKVMDFLEYPRIRKEDIAKLKTNFPNLISTNLAIPISALNKLNLRQIAPLTYGFDSDLEIRPRKLTVDFYNSRVLQQHQEVFNKVEHVVVYTDRFNFSVLTGNIRKIVLSTFNVESKGLTRFY